MNHADIWFLTLAGYFRKDRIVKKIIVYYLFMLIFTSYAEAAVMGGGWYHSVVVKSNGTVEAWGAGKTNGSLPNVGQSIVPANLSGVVAVSAGACHNLALKSNGTVAAWGWNYTWETNYYSKQSIVPSGVNNIIAVAAGGYHSLALRANGTVIGWGAGDGTSSYQSIYNSGQAIIPSGLNNVIAIAAGEVHSLALKSNGTVVAWGLNNVGQCSVPTNLNNVIAIAAGHSYSMALKSDGTVVAWGYSNYGECAVPSGLRNVIAISSTWQHTLALKSDGTIVAWGRNNEGQLNVPAGTFVAVSTGAYWSFALKSDGTIVTWGQSNYGQRDIPSNFKALLGPMNPIPNQDCFNGKQEDRSGNSADPVNTATGNFIHEETDLAIQTRTTPIEFKRFYNSKDARMTSLGQGWTHSYYVMLAKDINETNVNVCWGDGRTDYWKYDANTTSYKSAQAGLYDKLIKNTDGSWKVVKKNFDAYNFDSLGRLSAIVDKNGNTTSLIYNGSDPNFVTSIIDPANRTINLQYQSGRLTSISDFTSRSVSYNYMSGRLTQVTDVNSGTIIYSYDTNDYLKTITNQRGIVDVNNVYDANGRVIQQRDGRNFLSTFAYDTPQSGQTMIVDANGGNTIHTHLGGYRLLYSVKDAHGYEIKYAYDINANRTSITDRNGRITEFNYDSRGNVISTLDPNEPNNPNDGGITQVKYEDANFPDLPTKKIDALGNITTWQYDSYGNVKEQIDPNGNHRYWTYNGFGQKQTEIDEANNTTVYAYDADGKLTQKTDPNGNNIWFGHDSLWRLTDVTDGRGSFAGDPSHTVHTTYDKADRIISVTRPVTSESYGYDQVENRTRITNGRGYNTFNYYDGNGNLIKTEKDAPSSQKQTVTYHYDNLNRKSDMNDPLGNKIVYSYDVVGHLIAETNPEGNQTKYTYDAQGNILSVTDGNGVKTSFKYDWLNRKIEQYDLLGNHWYWKYDKLGRVTKYTDARGAKTKYGYGVLGRLISVTDDCNKITNYKYDKVGNLTDINDAGGIISARKFYDKSNRLIRQEDANGNAYEYRYDGAGNRIWIKDANEQITTCVYDNQNHLIEKHYLDSTQTIYGYDNNGNLTSSINSNGTTTFIYDELDRLTSSTDCFGKQVLYGYDIAGNRTSIVYPADTNNPARTVSYEYDTANRLKKITDWTGHNWNYTVDGAGRLKQLTNPNGVKENRTYDNAGRLSGLAYKKTDNTSLINYSYIRDRQGNPTNITETGTLSPNPQLPVKVSYNYDADNRLIDSSHPASYSYDNNGNLTTRTVNGVTANFGYDFENRLVSQSSTTENIQHVYDGQGNRIARIADGSATRYVLDYDRDMSYVLCETDNSGRITAYYIYGHQLVGRIGTDGSVRYYHSDHIGNIVALTEGSQNITDKYAYTPFGVSAGRHGTTANPFTFVGGLGVMAENDGLYFMRARFYDADAGRFLGKDLVEGKLTNPYTMHKYLYVIQNPICNFDPKGTEVESVSITLAGNGIILSTDKSTGEKWITGSVGLFEGAYVSSDMKTLKLPLIGQSHSNKPPEEGWSGGGGMLLVFIWNPEGRGKINFGLGGGVTYQWRIWSNHRFSKHTVDSTRHYYNGKNVPYFYDVSAHCETIKGATITP